MGAILAALGGAVAALLLVALVTTLRRRTRSRVDLEAMLAAAQRESDDLRTRLDELTAVLEPSGPAPEGRRSPASSATFVITDAGVRLDDETVEPIEVPDRLVLTATVGAPLVKVAAFSHGLRRALSPRSRNRIWFEVRSEVRAARKRRKQQVRDYLRETRAEARAAETRAQEGLA